MVASSQASLDISLSCLCFENKNLVHIVCHFCFHMVVADSLKAFALVAAPFSAAYFLDAFHSRGNIVRKTLEKEASPVNLL